MSNIEKYLPERKPKDFLAKIPFLRDRLPQSSEAQTQEEEKLRGEVLIKLLTDLQDGGYYTEKKSGKPDQRRYRTALMGQSGQKYYVHLDWYFRKVEQPGNYIVYMIAGDEYARRTRTLIFELITQGSAEPFDLPDYNRIDISNMTHRKRTSPDKDDLIPFSRRARKNFLNELLNAEVDQEENQRMFDEIQRNARSSKVRWSNTSEQRLLGLPKL